jgi:hypothetical protein
MEQLELIPKDWYLRNKCADLLHLLSFADIRTPTETDADEAAKVMAQIRHYLNTEKTA